MAIAFLVAVVVEDILFLIFSMGGFSWEGELGGVLLFFFLVYRRGMKRAFVFGGRILLGVQGRN